MNDHRPTASHWRSLEEVPTELGRCVVTLGVFDGLHRGHVALVRRARGLADGRGVPVVLVTFDPHPATVAGPPRDTTALVPVARRVELARRFGADHILVLPFRPALAAMPAPDFVRTVLVDTLHATDVVVGANFRFGHRGAGDVGLLRELGPLHGFSAHGVDLLAGCSSTTVRTLLARGDVRGAVAVLGRPHRVDGWVVESRVHLPSPVALPPRGRYRARVDGIEVCIDIGPGGDIHTPDHPNGPISLELLDQA